MKLLMGMLLIMSAFVEGGVLSFPLTLTVASGLAINWPADSAAWFLVAGTILDVFTPRTWGTSALFFLLTLVLLSFFRTKVYGRGLLFYALFIAIVQVCFSQLFAGGIHTVSIAEGTLLGVLLTILCARFGDPESEKNQLSV